MHALDGVSGKADNSGPVCIIVVAFLSVIGAVITPDRTRIDAGPPKASERTPWFNVDPTAVTSDDVQIGQATTGA